MKFKNSYILLISLISIFLLLSISSASAVDSDIAVDDAIYDIAEIDDINIKENILSDDASDAGDVNADTNDDANTNGTDSETAANDAGTENADSTGTNDTSNATNNSTNGTADANNSTNSTNSTNKTKYDGPVTNVTIIPVNDAVDYQSGNFTFKVVDNVTGEALANQNITVSGPYFYSFGNGTSLSTSKAFTTDDEGLITIPNVNLNKNLDTSGMVYNFTALAAGSYNLTFKGNDSIKVVSNGTLPITVKVVNAQIKASNLKTEVGSGKRYTFKVVNTATGEAIKLASLQFKINLNGSGYTVYNATTNLSGEAGFNLNLYGGKYPVTIVSKDSSIKASSVSRNITITKKTGVLTASNRTILYNSAPTAIIRLTDKKTGKAVSNGIVKVRLYTTSKKYTDLAFYTNKTGYVSFKAALSLGKHKMIISTADNNYTASSITRYVTLKKTTGKITAPKINAYYKGGKLYTVTLKNAKNNNPIYGAQLTIKIFVNSRNYYKYSGVTDGNGQVKINSSTLKPGTYKVTVSNADSGFSAKTVSGQLKVVKVPTKLAPTAFKEKVNSGKHFKVKVTNKNNNKILSGVKLNVKVYTSAKKYKTYSISSNNKGVAYLKVTQKVGTYKVVVTTASSYYPATAVTSKITVTK
ncbi:MAG: hypothetical protein IKV87_04780 [Methanobrevibacter sp.]|nr:hypothetical protein [Methanobrevibacter sp.]